MTDILAMTNPGTDQAGRPKGRLWRRFRRDQTGVTAIEFAFVGIPFILLMCAIIELALMFWTNQMLEEGLFRASRTVLTGEAKERYRDPANPDATTQAYQTAKFKSDICFYMTINIGCTSNIVIDVRNYDSFPAANTGTSGSNPISGTTLNTDGFGYTDPKPGKIVVVRAILPYPIIFTILHSGLINLTSGKRALIATIALRTEPF